MDPQIARVAADRSGKPADGRPPPAGHDTDPEQTGDPMGMGQAATRRGRRLHQDLATLRRLSGRRAARIAELIAERNRLLDRLARIDGHFQAWENEVGTG
jgi:hypothetical protein